VTLPCTAPEIRLLMIASFYARTTKSVAGIDI